MGRSDSDSRSAIVVTIEGMGTNMLGCYGGPWTPTPELDTFASQAIVFDQFWIDSLDWQTQLRSLWTGYHSLQPACDEVSDSAVSFLAREGIESTLFTDRAEMLSWPGLIPFARATNYGCQWSEGENWDDCHLAKWLEAGLGDWANDHADGGLLWLHSQGWFHPWDAPYAMRQALMDVDDGPAPNQQAPPEFRFETESDVDRAFGWAQAAAAQAQVLDRAWGLVDATVRLLDCRDRCLVILLGLGGYPLGQHGVVGALAGFSMAERIHSPCIVRPGNTLDLGHRSNRLSQPADLWRTLLDWFRIDVSMPNLLNRPTSRSWLDIEAGNGDESNRHPAYCVGDMPAIRVGSWGAVGCDSNSLPEHGEAIPADRLQKLFVHPEDRWQRNDVADRAKDVLDEINSFREDWVDWLASCDPAREPNEITSIEEPTPSPRLLERPS